MPDRLLLDTDVLIDYLRGRPEAVAYIEDLTAPLLISVVSVAELYAGVREGKERAQLESFLSHFEIVPLDPKIAAQGGLHRRDYGKSHSMGIVDGLVAATAESQQAVLVTLNKKHFPMLANVVVPYQKA